MTDAVTSGLSTEILEIGLAVAHDRSPFLQTWFGKMAFIKTGHNEPVDDHAKIFLTKECAGVNSKMRNVANQEETANRSIARVFTMASENRRKNRQLGRIHAWKSNDEKIAEETTFDV